jgi:hypothetical protein
MPEQAIHLGDGSYISRPNSYEWIVTANHHDPNQATDRVHIDDFAMKRLIAFVKEHEDEK